MKVARYDVRRGGGEMPERDKGFDSCARGMFKGSLVWKDWSSVFTSACN